MWFFFAIYALHLEPCGGAQADKQEWDEDAGALPEIDFFFALAAYTTSGQADLMDEYGVDTQEPTPMNLQLGQDSHIDVLFAMDTEEHFPRF